jgi:hypothetical protein
MRVVAVPSMLQHGGKGALGFPDPQPAATSGEGGLRAPLAHVAWLGSLAAAGSPLSPPGGAAAPGPTPGPKAHAQQRAKPHTSPPRAPPRAPVHRAAPGLVAVLPSLLAFDAPRFGLPPFADVVGGVIPLEEPFRISGAVVKGFGRGSKARSLGRAPDPGSGALAAGAAPRAGALAPPARPRSPSPGAPAAPGPAPVPQAPGPPPHPTPLRRAGARDPDGQRRRREPALRAGRGGDGYLRGLRLGRRLGPGEAGVAHGRVARPLAARAPRSSAITRSCAHSEHAMHAQQARAPTPRLPPFPHLCPT